MALPNTYYKLEYIESTGTQYIDTGYKSSNNIKIESTIKWTTQTENWAVFFGVTHADDSSNGILARIYNLVSTNFNPGFLNTNYEERQITTTVDTWHDITLQKNTIGFDGTNYSISTTGTAYQGNIFIFAGNETGSAGRNSKMSLKSFKMYDNDILVRDFIPAERISDGILGLYDLVNDKFYTNAGTGTFIAGTILYSITTSLSPNIGTISGEGYYARGETCTLAYNNNNQLYLVKQGKNGSTVLSTDVLTYSFVVNDNKSITVILQPCSIAII